MSKLVKKQTHLLQNGDVIHFVYRKNEPEQSAFAFTFVFTCLLLFFCVSSPVFWFADIAYIYQTIRPQESAAEDIEGKPSSCLTFIISKRKVAFLRPIRKHPLCFLTDGVGEEESDLTETESEPAPVEPVIVKPLPQCGHEEPQPSTSASSLRFFNMPLSTCSGNCGPRRVCTFLRVDSINKCTVKGLQCRYL